MLVMDLAKNIRCIVKNAIIQEQFFMGIDHALFLFCDRKCDRVKAILKESLDDYLFNW